MKYLRKITFSFVIYGLLGIHVFAGVPQGWPADKVLVLPDMGKVPYCVSPSVG